MAKPNRPTPTTEEMTGDAIPGHDVPTNVSTNPRADLPSADIPMNSTATDPATAADTRTVIREALDAYEEIEAEISLKQWEIKVLLIEQSAVVKTVLDQDWDFSKNRLKWTGHDGTSRVAKTIRVRRLNNKTGEPIPGGPVYQFGFVDTEKKQPEVVEL